MINQLTREVVPIIDYPAFESGVWTALNKKIDINSDQGQADTISASARESLFVVAGPGTGKTTAMTLRVLKLILVDDVEPKHLLATTFTKKAAVELRSRILGWGNRLRIFFMSNTNDSTLNKRLEDLDFNQITTGTLDSIAEDTLGDARAPGDTQPVVIEDLAANTLMIREGILNRRRQSNEDLQDYVKHVTEDARTKSPSDLSKTIRVIGERFYHDQADLTSYRNANGHPGVPVLCDALDAYDSALENKSLHDFARLEQSFLDWLTSPASNRFKDDIKFLLVDEYQDTNLLQESIYFELAKSVNHNGGSITVVGDDDQSIFRFRGATVDLFQNFLTRLQNSTMVRATQVNLIINYRSTKEIVEHCNSFITLDNSYQAVRVAGKQSLKPYFGNGLPILGMFRFSAAALARDLTAFIKEVVNGSGFTFTDRKGVKHTIKLDPSFGKPSDVAFLVSSPNELNSTGNPRLPRLLRQMLRESPNPINVFNPRGQNLFDITSVSVLCGLVLECIDPNSAVQNSQRYASDVQRIFSNWRDSARDYMNNNPAPASPISLRNFVKSWQDRRPSGKSTWDREVPITDLIYKLLTWIPAMHNDIEGLVFLEAIVRTVEQAGLIGNFDSKIVFDQSRPRLEEASIKEVERNVFEPIASGLVEIDEDLLETLPDDRISIMSIHQSKGLEFPLVIVDIGSDFNRDHPKQRPKRFPESGGTTCNMEDEVRPHSPLGLNNRSGIDRAFDDLIRLYFEAYSRPQDALLVVGLTTMMGQIKSVATGWDRNENWNWRGLSNLVLL
jgi:DNA helicase-2/ATP-dependent DNA helicase PcrA